jgi:2-keto-4-pentenoate hydratase
MPAECRPADADSAIAIQNRVTQLLGETVGGWKASVPSKDRTVVGPIYARTIVFQGPDCPAFVEHGKTLIEPEIAFVMARGLPPRSVEYSEDEVRSAVRSAHLALELLASRYAESEELEFPEKLADGLSNFGLYLGPQLQDAHTRELGAFPVTISGASGMLVSKEGKHPDGHPLKPLHWLANFLSSRGQGLESGQAVTTGSYAGAIEVPAGEPLRITFGDLGQMAVELRAS